MHISCGTAASLVLVSGGNVILLFKMVPLRQHMGSQLYMLSAFAYFYLPDHGISLSIQNYIKRGTKIIFLQGDHKNNVALIKSKKILTETCFCPVCTTIPSFGWRTEYSAWLWCWYSHCRCGLDAKLVFVTLDVQSFLHSCNLLFLSHIMNTLV